MKLISHRGNLAGPDPSIENNPEQIKLVLSKGFDVEIDVWLTASSFYLGHDEPTYKIDSDFLLQHGLWCHAKNLSALEAMLEINAHCFWHEQDTCTLTSKGFVWTYPGKPLTQRSICVMPEIRSYTEFNCFGICTDFIYSRMPQ